MAMILVHADEEYATQEFIIIISLKKLNAFWRCILRTAITRTYTQ
jgi:hypothetical protein